MALPGENQLFPAVQLYKCVGVDKTVKLYKGKVQLRFNEDSHRYDVSLDDGKTWAKKYGVTTIMSAVLAKPGLALWPMNMAVSHLKVQDPTTGWTTEEWTALLETASKAHTVRSDKGKDTGTIVHKAIENYLTGEPFVDDLTPESAESFYGWLLWFEGQEFALEDIECVLYSKKHDYCGTADAILMTKDKLILADWKTNSPSRYAPKGVYPEMFIQLGAYAEAYTEETGNKLDDLMIGNAGKTGKFNAVYASEVGLSVQDCIDAWLNVLSIFKFNKPLKKRLQEMK